MAHNLDLDQVGGRLFIPQAPSFPSGRLKRVLLKLSGEALAGDQSEVVQELVSIFVRRLPDLTANELSELVEELTQCVRKINFGVDPITVARFASEIAEARHNHGTEFGIVVGGGNIWRGSQHPEMDRAQADKAGMLATIINALALQDHLEKFKQPTRVMTAFEVKSVAEPYVSRRAIRHIEKGRAVILAAGTGNPFFTTDTTAVLRGREIEAEAVLMAKHGVDGIYTDDPNTNPDATRYDVLEYLEVIQGGLQAMDLTAVTLAMDNKLPIVAFDGLKPGALEEIILNPALGTIIN